MMLFAILSMLGPQQQHLVDNMSALVLHESSELEKMTTSDSDKGEALRSTKGTDMQQVVRRVLSSRGYVDRRLASIFGARITDREKRDNVDLDFQLEKTTRKLLHAEEQQQPVNFVDAVEPEQVEVTAQIEAETV